MKNLSILFLFLAAALPAAELKTIDDFQAAATRANRVLTFPEWERTPEALTASIMDAIGKGNAALDQIGSQHLEYVTFESTIVALEDLRRQAGLAANRAALISETNPDPVLRAVAESALKKFQEWSVGIDYRDDVYKAIKAFAATHPKLKGGDEKLFAETLRDYHRGGMNLQPDQRKEVERMRTELSKLAAEFDSNLFAAKAPVVFTKAELEGVPDDFLSSPVTPATTSIMLWLAVCLRFIAQSATKGFK